MKLMPGAVATISGHVLGLPPDGSNVVIDRTATRSFSILDGMAGKSGVDGKTTLTLAAVLGCSGSVLLTASAAQVTESDGIVTSAEIADGTTLTAGGAAETVSGHAVSPASGGSLVVDEDTVTAGATLTKTVTDV